MFAVAPESHAGRRVTRAGRGRDRAARHPRPQRRNPGDRRAHAVAVRRAAPHHRRRRGGRAAHRRDAGPRCARAARAARLQARFVWLKREITPKQRADIHRLGLPGHRLPAREQARLSERRRGLAPDRARQHRQPGHRRHREVARQERARRSAPRGACDRPAAEAGRACRRPARAARAARRTDRGAREIQGEGGGRPPHRRAHRRDRRHGLGAGLRPQQSARGARSDPHQPADHRRVRDGLDLQGAHAGDGARFRQVHAQFDRSMRARRCTTASSPSTTTIRRTAC